MWHPHNEGEEESHAEALQQWVLDKLLCLEVWKWLWNPDLSLNLLSSLTHQPLPHSSFDATSVSLLTMCDPTAPSISAPTAGSSSLATPNKPALSTLVPSVENEVMWTSIAQPQALQAYPELPLKTLEGLAKEGLLESGSQAYKGGNVMIETPTLSYSPSFSFDNFITYAFTNIAMDLDSFI